MPSDSREPDLSALLLAGGRADRFGSNKALATFRGRPLAMWALGVLREISDDIWISANHEHPYRSLGHPIVKDLYPGHGPLAGLHAALSIVRHDLLAVAACDMPFASAPLFRHLARLAPGHDVVVPMHGEPPLYEPLHAIYHRRCREPIERALREGQRKVAGFFESVRVREVPEEQWRHLAGQCERIFQNINTREDLRELGRLNKGNSPRGSGGPP